MTDLTLPDIKNMLQEAQIWLARAQEAIAQLSAPKEDGK